MDISEIILRDPFILVHNKKYYLYGSRMHTEMTRRTGEGQGGFDVYQSHDLCEWSGPKQILGKEGIFENTFDFWAPEVHEYKGRFYMFATMKDCGHGDRACYILVSDTPDGSFELHSDGAVTPKGWECLDGTLYVEDGKPYMVFCREWRQVCDGEMYGVELSEDLKKAVGEPKLLYRASESKWAGPINNRTDAYVTDGPFLFKEDGVLYSIWSSFKPDNKYAVGIACSKTGKIFGEWEHIPEMLFCEDGGHGMIFKTLEGERKIVLHTPNNELNAHPTVYDFVRNGIGEYVCR